MSKSKQTATGISQSSELRDVLARGILKEMIDLLAKHEPPVLPLMETPTAKSEQVRPPSIPLDARTGDIDDDDYLLPGHREIDSANKATVLIDCNGMYYDDKSNYLGRNALMVKPRGSKDVVHLYSGYSDNYLDGYVVAGGINGEPPQAFFTNYWANNEATYFEADEFCFLGIINETCDMEEAAFVYFNRNQGILFVGFVLGDPRLKNPKLSAMPRPKTKVSKKTDDTVKDFIKERFETMATRYGKCMAETKRKSECSPRNLNTEIPFHSLSPDKHGFTQERMKELCRVIRNRSRYLDSNEYTEIDFRKMTQVAHGYTFGEQKRLPYLDVMMKTTSGNTISFIMGGDDSLDALIIAGDDGGSNSAFLVVKGEDGEERIHELEQFSILSVWHRKGEHRGLYTVYNRIPNVLVSDYVAAYPVPKLSLFDKSGGKEKPTPAGDKGKGDNAE